MGRSFPCRRPPPPSPVRSADPRPQTGLTGRSQSGASVIPAQPLRRLRRHLPINGEEFSLPAASASFTCSVSRPTSADRIDGTISVRGISHPGAAPPAASPPPPHKWGGVFLAGGLRLLHLLGQAADVGGQDRR